MYADLKGMLWLNGSYPLRPRPGGTVQKIVFSIRDRRALARGCEQRQRSQSRHVLSRRSGQLCAKMVANGTLGFGKADSRWQPLSSARQLNRTRLLFARARAYIGGMDDLTYWTEKLRQAEQELDAARTRTEVNEAAKRLHRAKAELKRLEIERTDRSKRRPSRDSGSAVASS
jgi:hypothetical protein